MWLRVTQTPALTLAGHDSPHTQSQNSTGRFSTQGKVPNWSFKDFRLTKPNLLVSLEWWFGLQSTFFLSKRGLKLSVFWTQDFALVGNLDFPWVTWESYLIIYIWNYLWFAASGRTKEWHTNINLFLQHISVIFSNVARVLSFKERNHCIYHTSLIHYYSVLITDYKVPSKPYQAYTSSCQTLLTYHTEHINGISKGKSLVLMQTITHRLPCPPDTELAVLCCAGDEKHSKNIT